MEYCEDNNRATMKIVFAETAEDERDYFAGSFPGHTVEFASSLAEVPEDAEVVSVHTTEPVEEKFYKAHPLVRLVVSRSSTVDHIDAAAAVAHGVSVAHVPDYGAATVAEHVFALLFGVARRLRHCGESRTTSDLRGMQLRGKTLGVIGTGNVGWQVVLAAAGFGLKVVAHDRSPDHDLSEQLGFQYLPLEELFARSEIITLHVPLTSETRHLIGRKALALCVPGVIIINTAHGALLDTDAVLEGLRSGKVGGLGVDSLEDDVTAAGGSTGAIAAGIIRRMHAVATPGGDATRKEERLRELQGIYHNKLLLEHPDVFYTPHVGFNTREAVEQIDRYTAETILQFLSGKVAPESLVVSAGSP